MAWDLKLLSEKAREDKAGTYAVKNQFTPIGYAAISFRVISRSPGHPNRWLEAAFVSYQLLRDEDRGKGPPTSRRAYFFSILLNCLVPCSY
jgi:hypothetical protein